MGQISATMQNMEPKISVTYGAAQHPSKLKKNLKINAVKTCGGSRLHLKNPKILKVCKLPKTQEKPRASPPQ